MKIVILEGETINPGDLSWSALEKFGDLTVYDRCSQSQASDLIKDAEIVFFSKIDMTREIMEAHPSIKLLCITATGYDNLDVQAAKDLGIACCNVPAYATDAVAQHTFALLLELTNHVGQHSQHVHLGGWDEAMGFCYWLKPLCLLNGKSLGIVGYGSIGKKVANIGKAFGMKVNIYSKNPEEALRSDFISLHIPATPKTLGFINKDTIAQMKDGVFIVNTARGSLIVEEDLASALKNGKVAGYAADVLSNEPPALNNPLIAMPQVVLTPHNAWCPIETRKVVCDICAENLAGWLNGLSVNRLDI